MIEQTTDPIKGAETCESIMSYITKVGGGLFKFNANMFDYDYKPNQRLVIDFLENSHMKMHLYRAIHIDQSFKKPRYNWSNSKVKKALSADLL
jgi:hypothetical protein